VDCNLLLHYAQVKAWAIQSEIHARVSGRAPNKLPSKNATTKTRPTTISPRVGQAGKTCVNVIPPS
jgi:hypothetical protein